MKYQILEYPGGCLLFTLYRKQKLQFKVVNLRRFCWPTAAINGSEFRAQIMTAFWPGREPASMDGALADGRVTEMIQGSVQYVGRPELCD
jgi:hypothetical protein